jgi:hypothetical protein
MSSVKSEDFISVFGQAPEAYDFSGPFAPSQPSGSVNLADDDDPDRIPTAPKYKFKWYRRVFLIYRPWHYCDRCRDAIANGTLVLPAEGDHECPHTMREEYHDLMNKILEGKLLLGAEAEITNKDGSVAVSVRWYEPTDKPKKRTP